MWTALCVCVMAPECTIGRWQAFGKEATLYYNAPSFILYLQHLTREYCSDLFTNFKHVALSLFFACVLHMWGLGIEVIDVLLLTVFYIAHHAATLKLSILFTYWRQNSRQTCKQGATEDSCSRSLAKQLRAEKQHLVMSMGCMSCFWAGRNGRTVYKMS